MTYTDSRDFPMSSWSDVSDWPHLDTLANQGFIIIGVSLEKQVEQGNRETKAAFDTFRNKFVQENCHRDVEIRTWDTWDIPDMGEDQSVYISTRAKHQTPIIINIGCFLALAATCLSCPLKTYLRKKTKLVQVKVRKLYYYDPKKAVPDPSSFYPSGDSAPDIVLRTGNDNCKLANGTADTKGVEFLPSRSFSIEMENLSFRQVKVSNLRSLYFLGINS